MSCGNLKQNPAKAKATSSQRAQFFPRKMNQSGSNSIMISDPYLIRTKESLHSARTRRGARDTPKLTSRIISARLTASGREPCCVVVFIYVCRLTTDFKHRRTAAFENQRLYGQIECAIGGFLQGIVRPKLHITISKTATNESSWT